jgi:hypothetical protein
MCSGSGLLVSGTGLRKITPASGEPVYLVIIDEYAYFSATRLNPTALWTSAA